MMKQIYKPRRKRPPGVLHKQYNDRWKEKQKRKQIELAEVKSQLDKLIAEKNLVLIIPNEID